jgi:predicted dinucleotide-binding enzyme
MDSARMELGDKPRYAGSAEDCVRGADVVVLAVPWKEFLQIPAAAFSPRRVLIDAWRFAPEGWRTQTDYIPLGANVPAQGK